MSMSSCGNGSASAPIGRLVLGDCAWVALVAIVAGACGIVGDQFFRQPPLGLRYQTTAERLLTSPAPEPSGAAAINLVPLDEMDALLVRDDVLTLDARPSIFYELGHLPGAQNLSREEFEKDFSSLQAALELPGKTLLIYCSDAGCEDSVLVARALQKRGFSRLLIFPGGFTEWEAAGRPVEMVE